MCLGEPAYCVIVGDGLWVWLLTLGTDNFMIFFGISATILTGQDI